ncbi:MAG: hypothetical protein IPK82_17645 [Polyangiaceae bacterium]|nr:hypothetical protein [Polyangiaceae bacterium]
MPTATNLDPTPSPPPASAVLPVEARDKAGKHPSSNVSERPDLFECVERGCRGRDQVGLEEAARQFEGDLRAELAAIAAGTHPLQQRRSAPR